MKTSADVIRNIFWQPLRIADHDKANEVLDALVAELEEAVAALREVKQAAFEREIELVAEKNKLLERLEEVKRLASDPFASEAVALRACLLTAYEGLGLPGPEPSPQRDIARAIIKEYFGE